jgi:putative transposase
MPRKARIDAPGALHHIIVRGIERRRIFLDDQDRDNFIERLGDIVTETKTFCFAWALIPNHVHILLRTGLTSLATVMKTRGQSLNSELNFGLYFHSLFKL